MSSGSMSEDNGHGGADPKYAKAKKWSEKKIDRAIDQESQSISLTNSMIKKHNSEVQNLIQKSSELIGESVNQDNLNNYIQKVSDKVLQLELINIDNEIKSILVMKVAAEKRLLMHKASKNYLMYLSRSKNQ
jgi:replicative DNA helicase